MDTPLPTYHMCIWDEPPTYSCLLCLEARGLPLETVTTHLREVHDAPAVPPTHLPQLLALRAEAFAQTTPPQVADIAPVEKEPTDG